MNVDERQRYHLHQSLERELGSDAAATLMTLLPPAGWADIATKRDLDALGHELRSEMADLRGELRTGLAEVRTEIRKTARAMTFTIVGATAAIVTVIAIVTSLFG